jgi:superfamily II DNA/RNA helicase
MNIFNVHNSIIDEYSKYISSFLEISDKRIRDAVDDYFTSRKLWPQPLIQFNPFFDSAESIDELCDKNIMHPELKNVFNVNRLYKHQVEALKLGSNERNFIVTSGTGSGKSLTFIGSIFNYLFSNPGRKKGITALIVYPMNALINSQFLEIDKYKNNYEENTGKQFPITFRQYTGQESKTEKEEVLKELPNILLTNYMMLELIMTRLGERDFRNSIADHLRFLVFDELHTYRGRQGSDVSMLIRRINSKCKNKIVSIGTSATMVSGTSIIEQKQKVVEVAEKIFGQKFEIDQIINEKLIRSVSDGKSKVVKSELIRELESGFENGLTKKELIKLNLACWFENEIALDTADGELVRKKPLMRDEIIKLLSLNTGLGIELCESRINQFLILVNEINKKEGKTDSAILPFKVHQFIAQTGTVYVTLESSEERIITLDPAGIVIDDEGEKKPLYPVIFSRTSGMEFICVKKDISKKILEPREFNQRIPEEEEENVELGYIITEQEEPIWSSEQLLNLPDSWLKIRSNGEADVKKEYKDKLPQRISFDEFGKFSDNENEFAYKGWFMTAPLLFDPTSGTFYDRKTAEGTKLTKLGTEGRSTATTILAYSAIKALEDENQKYDEQKLLSFTDNRQDAALQAGHFNDFYRVGKLRAAIYQALNQSQSKTLDHSTITQQVFQALNLKQEQYAKNPSPLPFQTEENENAFKNYLTYRILSDLKRGWRVTLPNLEQCGLLQIAYKHLKETCEVKDFWKDLTLLSRMNVEERYDFLIQVIDYFRKNYALAHTMLEPNEVTRISSVIREEIKPEWGLDENDKIDLPYYMRVETLTANYQKIYTASIGAQSYFGKFLKAEAKKRDEVIDKNNYTDFVYKLLDKLVQAKYLSLKEINQGKTKLKLYRLEVKTILWKIGDGETVIPDKIRLQTYKDYTPKINKYFRDFYQQDFSKLKIIEAREHTAQIKNEDRKIREKQFRDGDISLLSCSPTMELGIDIATLNIVHLRNVPPSPANYAQRSGRAGRSGQAALVLTFCSNYSPHDKHYFKNSADMVSGVVRPSRIDLLNEELMLTHLNAIYLSKAGINALDYSIGDLVVIDDLVNLKLKDSVRGSISFNTERKNIVRMYFKNVINQIENELVKTYWYKEDWIRKNIDDIPRKFDEALNRWREIYKSAIRQRARAQEIINNPIYSNYSEERKRAYAEEKQANKQIDLLMNRDSESNKNFSEFYPYRYLASEGFLPGYNFTRLPVRAYIPKGEDGEFVSRPRFLALREFGPGNIIYHDGARYKINQMIQHEMESKIERMKVSKSSNYALMGEDYQLEYCPFTKVYLKTDKEREIYTDILPLSENRSYQIDRISCEEEERQSMGYDIKTFFTIEGVKDRVETVVIKDGTDALLKVRYIPAATLIKLNEKWRSKKEPGFLVNIKTGFWKSEKDLEQGNDPTNIRRIRLFTKDTADAIYIHPLKALSFKDGLEADSIITLQFALKRAIENIYQVEQNEIGVEVMGSTDWPNILIYEAAEGSLGVLSQLVCDKDEFKKVINEAYKVCYFQNGEDTNPKAGPATYEDLLNYYNQWYHQRIDRYLIKDQLERLMICEMEARGASAFENYDEQYEFLLERIDPNSSTEKKFLKFLFDSGLKLPDEAQYSPSDLYVRPDFYYKNEKACVFCDGTPHDDKFVREDDKKKREALRNKGYDVIEFYYKDSLEDLVRKRSDIFHKVK